MPETASRKRSAIIAAFFVLLTLIGLLVTPNYGMPWDELMEIRTLGTNLREYAGVFTDEAGEPQKSATGIEFTDVLENPDIDHGQSVYYPLTPVLFTDLGEEAPRTLMLIYHAYTFLIFMLGVVGLYFLGSRLLGDWKYGIVASLFLYLSPRFFAEGHYNSKDIISMSMIILCLWFFYQFLQTRKYRHAILFALAGAFAANMRISGLLFFGLAGVCYLISVTVRKEWSVKKALLPGLVAVVAFVVFYTLLTPVMWHSPIDFISYVFKRSSNYSDWNGVVFYMGKSHQPVPWHYVPVLFALTTPIFTVLMTIIGNIAAFATLKGKKIKEIFGAPQLIPLMSFVCIWVFLGYAMIRRPVLYDSWRHFYFLNGLLMLLATLGVKFIIDLLRGKAKKIAAGVVAAAIAASGLVIVINHPNELVYYNVLAGSDPAKSYEMDYWNVSQVKALMELIDKTDSDEVITVTAAEWMSMDGLRKAYDILPAAYKTRMKVTSAQYGQMDRNADYLMISLRAYQVTRDELGRQWVPDAGLSNYMATCEKTVALNAFGSEYMLIYKLP